jgi:hypothetical protein
MSEHKIVIDTEKSIAPEGWEFTGEYRKALSGEFCLLDFGHIYQGASLEPHPILRKKKSERKRVELHGLYWTIDYIDFTVISKLDCQEFRDERRFASGNYFYSREVAEEAAHRVKETLAAYHQEILDSLG